MVDKTITRRLLTELAEYMKVTSRLNALLVVSLATYYNVQWDDLLAIHAH